MYITSMNSNNNILVRVHLEAGKFCYYNCNPLENKPYVMVGVNMSNLFKLIKFLNNDDELFLSYDKRNINELNLQYINYEKNVTSNYYLKLLDLKEEEHYNIDQQTFDFVISMQSSNFHTLIKNMSVIADKVDIKFINTDKGYSLTFSCEGEFASQETTVNGIVGQDDDDKLVNVSKNVDDNMADNIIIQGVYELKTLSLFSKCASLCPLIDIYIKNNSLLVIKYKVADMGSIHLILSPKIDTDNNLCDSESDSDSDNDL